MKHDGLFLIILSLFLLVLILLTVLFGKGKSRHGVGRITPPASVSSVCS